MGQVSSHFKGRKSRSKTKLVEPTTNFVGPNSTSNSSCEVFQPKLFVNEETKKKNELVEEPVHSLRKTDTNVEEKSSETIEGKSSESVEEKSLESVEEKSSEIAEEKSLKSVEEKSSEENVEELTKDVLNLSLITNIVTEDHYNNDCILKDANSIEYLSKSQAMIMMKGLPGSGKSTVVRALTKIYRDSTVCSADTFFMRSGKYQFDVNKLSEAHNSCKMAAIEACQNNTPIIIIDNTNVQNWEMKFYIYLAEAFNYIVIVIEPNTPWSKNPVELSAKNSHGVELSILRQKVKKYDAVNPIYYGWFLNEADSFQLLKIAQGWLEKVLLVKEFLQDFTHHTKLVNTSDVLEHFSKAKFSLQSARLLHCTAKYTAKGGSGDLDQYMSNPSVNNAIGKISKLFIIGYVITPNTFGARLALTQEQLNLWGGEDSLKPKTSEQTNLASAKRKKKFHGPPQSEQTVKIPTNQKKFGVTATKPSLEEVLTDTGQKNLSPTGCGSRAHITLGVALGVPPVNTGLELMKVIEKESNLDYLENKTKLLSMPGALLKDYGMGMWGIYPDHKVQVDSIFSYKL